MAPRLFALDHAFPQPVVEQLAMLFEHEARLVPIQDVDPEMPELDDWEVLLALHHDARSWDGLITTDAGMLSLARELWVLMRTRLSLVVTQDSGDDPVRATGLLFVHLSAVCKRTSPTVPQLWRLRAREQGPVDPMDQVKSAAEHRNVSVGDFMAEGELSWQAFQRNPLSA